MGVNRTTDVLRATPVFRGIDDHRLRVVAMVGRTLRYNAGEVIFRRGEDGDAAYVVISGVVDVVIPTPKGDQKIAELGPGELFGEIAVLCDRSRTSTIVAEEDAEVLRLDREMLLGLMADLPDLAQRMIRMLAGRLETTTLALAGARSAVEPRA